MRMVPRTTTCLASLGFPATLLWWPESLMFTIQAMVQSWVKGVKVLHTFCLMQKRYLREMPKTKMQVTLHLRHPKGTTDIYSPSCMLFQWNVCQLFWLYSLLPTSSLLSVSLSSSTDSLHLNIQSEWLFPSGDSDANRCSISVGDTHHWYQLDHHQLCSSRGNCPICWWAVVVQHFMLGRVRHKADPCSANIISSFPNKAQFHC